MRQSYIFYVNNPSDLKTLLLSKSKEVDYISVLDSNMKIATASLPPDYINYDLLAGFDALEVLEVDEGAFNSLRAFHLQYQDWLFGYLSYDIKNELEQLNSRNYDGIKAASLSFFIPKYVLVLKGNQLTIHTYETKESCKQFLRKIDLDQDWEISSMTLKRRESKDVYLQKIAKIKMHIQRGDIYEMNYCQEFFAREINLNPSAVFWNLNKNTTTPFSSFLKLNHIYAMCTSPERFIRKSNNQLISQPIKGTRKRGAGKEQDDLLIKELGNSEKDISENIMIADLVRNDLSITAIKGSVKVKELCEVYTFEKVHQMITTITSEVDEKIHFSKILESVFPMGSMTGVPKLKAMELIEEFESFKRGVFSGAIGYITPKGDFDFNVVIRTILYNERTKYLSVGVGGAITIKSDAEEEYEECLVKINPIFKVLNFQLDEE